MTDRSLGPIVPDWTPAKVPNDVALSGAYADLRALDAKRDAPGLWRVFEGHDHVWDYLFEPAPADFGTFAGYLALGESRTQQPCLVIRAKDDPAPLGYACYWTIVPEMGNIEIGNVNLSPALQRTRIATEAFFLMIDWGFAHGYRRLEWKCNALNAPSRAAALRMGFQFEGIFRQHLIVKGRNRDTAWYALTDGDWRGLRPAYVAFLDPVNFDAAGVQNRSLSSLIAQMTA